MSIYFIRHGQTDWNKELRIQGISDVALNEQGRLQGQALAKDFLRRQVKFSKLWSSPLKRAFETAGFIGENLRVTVSICEELKEFNFGDWEGKTSQDISDDKALNEWLMAAFSFPPPKGESFKDMKKKLGVFLEKTLLLESERDVGVVAHQGTLVALKSLIIGNEDPEVLYAYRQANNEVDIFCTKTLELSRFSIQDQ